MPYGPFQHGWPYSNFHDLNLDWVINTVKQLSAEWASTEQEWNTQQEAFESLKAYVNQKLSEYEEWISNLDLQEEVNNKLEAMQQDGSLAKLLDQQLLSTKLNIMPKDRVLQFTGVFQNEKETTYTYPNYINFGVPNQAPYPKGLNTGLDIVAFFYNDFGLHSTAASPSQAYGSYVWYDWSWNFKDVPEYDPHRVPSLGYYAGDNPQTLDWILYWLRNCGVTTLCLALPAGYDFSGWNPAPPNTDPLFWTWVLFSQCKNISAFRVIPTLGSKHGATSEEVSEYYNTLLSWYDKYKALAHSVSINGRVYDSVYMFFEEGTRGTLDSYSGHTNTLQYFKNLQAAINGKTGHDGLIVFADDMNLPEYGVSDADEINTNESLIFMKARYNNVSSSINYTQYAAGVQLPTQYKNFSPPTVMTSGQSMPPHPSNWKMLGSTPALFGQAVRSACNYIGDNNCLPMLFVYNVSEWAEGGPGLIPNITDGFGYLDALSTASNQKSTIPATADEFYTSVNISSLSKGQSYITVPLGSLQGTPIADIFVSAQLIFTGDPSITPSQISQITVIPRYASAGTSLPSF